MAEETKPNFESWAILELMGHRRLGGFVTEVTLFGTAMLRIDIPKPDTAEGWTMTQYYGGGSLYCLTPTDEATARAIAKHAQPRPVHGWEMPRLAPPPNDAGDDPGDGPGDDDEF